jgi:NAD(P)H-flavin reductase
VKRIPTSRNINRNFHFVPTFTRIAPGQGGWKGTTGPINTQMLSNYISNSQDPIYYVAGPPGMVAGLTKRWLSSLSVKKTFVQTVLQVIERKSI